ncbi:MAG TPA: hypothetical protein PLA50_04285 [Bacteroidia bacterium]|nr:hypothetical protein [Bacteroidia bacterium]
MNSAPSDNPFGPASPDERLVDAALSEHARLGRERHDDELVLRILAETVHRPQTVPSPALRSARRLPMPAIPMIGTIAALLALLLAALSSLPTAKAPQQRFSDEVRFVVHIQEPQASATPQPGSTPVASVLPASGPIGVPTWQVSGLPRPAGLPTIARVDVERYPSVGTALDALPHRSLRSEDLRITADRGQQSEQGLVYEGQVVIEHRDFRIEAVRAQIPSSPSADATLLANGVRVVQPSSQCVAEAEALHFDPAKGELVLTGVSRMETSKGTLAHFQPNDQLVLSSRGFSIETRH